MPVSKRTTPSPLEIAQALTCGTPGHGHGNLSLQTPGRIFSLRATSLRPSGLIAASLSRPVDRRCHGSPVSIALMSIPTVESHTRVSRFGIVNAFLVKEDD